MTPEQRLTDAEKAMNRAYGLYQRIWADSEKLRVEAGIAYMTLYGNYRAAKAIVAEKS